ncbi:MAG: amino acid adenylation domain-containing protein, partial [Acidobacteriota bacterium]
SGELCLAGASLARGYFHRPAATAQVFVPCPVAQRPGARLYRTGDQARLLPDGRIDFLGRDDHQIKIRGYRIELGEIEAILTEHPAVAEAAVLASESRAGDTMLTAYVAAADGTQRQELRQHAATRLPEYMVPAAWAILDHLPWTPNGKIDRRALAEITIAKPEPSVPSRKPVTVSEELLVEIFEDVLGIGSVGVDDNFFDLGGHSLLATQVISRIRTVFGLELQVKTIFETPRVSGLAQTLDRARVTAVPEGLPPLAPRSQTGPAPLSFAQQRLWFLDRLDPDSNAYNIPLASRLRGPLEVRCLERSFSEVWQRHDALRTRFVEHDAEPLQIVDPATPLVLSMIDLSGLEDREQRDETWRWAAHDASSPFDLQQGPLFRVCLIRLAAEDHVLLAAMHHIVSDGWSTDILQREISTLYRTFQAGQHSPLTNLPLQYGDFAAWQRGWLRGEALEREIAYWRDGLAGAPTVLDLPTDRPRPPTLTFRGAAYSFRWAPELWRDVQALSRTLGATPFMTLLASFSGLLGRWTGARDLTVGTPISGRSWVEVESLIGFFVNTLVLRADLQRDPDFQTLVDQVRATSLEAHAHQHVPFEKLVEELEPVRNAAHTPLFQVLFTFRNAAKEDSSEPGDLEITELAAPRTTAKFDLSLFLEEDAGQLAGSFEFRNALFDRSTIARLAQHLEVLLRAAVRDPRQRLSRLPLLPAVQRHELLSEWNDTAVDRGPTTPIHRLFEAQVRRSPDAIAVLDDDRQTTYRELDRQANRLAHHLRHLGVERETRIGIYLDRSLEIAVAVLAVLKAGGAYVPLDQGYPPERLAFMIEDAEMGALITRSRWLSSLPESRVATVLLDRDRAAIQDRSARPVPARVAADNLAYVIYTSGSTGRPKGVLVPHHGLLNAIGAGIEMCAAEPGDRLVQVAALSFDASVFELWVPLFTGGTLTMIRREILLSGSGMVEFLRQKAIAHMMITPSALASLPAASLPHLATVAAAGEACSAELVSRWAPGRRFLNVYGPTEATIWSTGAICRASGMTPTIGQPITNMQTYVVDRGQRPVPLGSAGELQVRGPGLTRGYLGRAGLTAERFVPSPFGSCGGRLYRTGDLARHRPSGEIEYLGRLDHQVKVRGFRIELGEIEAQLRRHPSIEEAVAITRPDPRGENAIFAYLVPAATSTPAIGALRSYLGESLPEHMIPATFVEIPTLPLNPNGKVDRAALPEPQRSRHRGSTAPRDELEQQLTEIWEEVLGIGSLGVDESFFELGGHSLLAVRLMARVAEATGQELPLASLFEGPTIEHMANRLRHGASPSEERSLVCLRQGQGQPLFLVHPIGGNVLCYAELAERLPGERPVFALQAAPDDATETIEEMATAYLEAIRRVQPNGPYALAGWSMGGIVAFEIAQQLHDAQELASSLVLIDSPAPMTGYYADVIDPENLLPAFISDLAALGGFDALDLLQGMEGESEYAVWEKAQTMGLLPADIDFDTAQRLFATFRRNSIALARYRGTSYEGPTTLLRCAEGPRDLGSSLGWEKQASARFVVHEVPGNHYSTFQEPNLTSLISRIAAALDS